MDLKEYINSEVPSLLALAIPVIFAGFCGWITKQLFGTKWIGIGGIVGFGFGVIIDLIFLL